MSSGQEVGNIFGQDEGYGPSTSLLRSPTVLIASIGLWGMNILLFRQFGIDHVRVLTGSISMEGDESIKGESSLSISKADAASTGSAKTTVTSTSTSLSSSSVPTNISASDHQVTAYRCFSLSILLFILLNTTTFLYVNFMPGESTSVIGAIFIFYLAVIIGVVAPCNGRNQWIRNALKVVFYRAAELLHPRCHGVADLDFDSDSSTLSNTPPSRPPRPIPFVDVFFADAMCSLSKVFFDWGMLWHLASHYPDPVPVSVHSILIPSAFAALPYLIRARQCIVMYYVGKFSDDPKRYQHTLNAIKYSTSLFPICLSAYQKTVSDQTAKELETYLVILFIINSLYSYAWDVLMDWGMMQNPTAALTQSCAPKMSNKPNPGCIGLFLRSRLRFGGFLSLLILLADGVFRFGWLLRFYEATFFKTVDEYILFTELLEVFRRAIWNLLRVEWENIKQTKTKVNEDYRTEDDDPETTQFLLSSNGNIQMAPVSTVMRASTSNPLSANSSLGSTL